jgi:hypothetical protein
MATRALAEHVKAGLAAGAVVGVAVAAILARLRARARENEGARELIEREPVLRLGRLRLNARNTFFAGLVGFALFATLNYCQYTGALPLRWYHNYDLLHYYTSAKYFDEVGYFDLLPALIAADREGGEYCPGQVRQYLAQDENDYHREPIRHALARADEVKKRFSEEEWKQFVHDARHIQRAPPTNLSCKLWRELLLDHGFNGTPTWVLFARPFAKLIPVEAIKVACYLDFLWLLAALVAVWWAFGREAFAFSWLFLMVSYSLRWPIISWAFLRYDWIAAMTIGVCMLRRDKHWAAGALFGYATLMRYFPLLWLFGIFAKALHSLLNNVEIPWTRFWRRVPLRYWKVAGGFFGAVLVLLSLSIAVDGVDVHAQSLHNITAHIEPHNLSSRRQGLVIPLVYRGETEQKLISDEKREMVAEIESYVHLAALLLLIPLGLFISRTKDWYAAGLGVIPYFWLTTSSYYYYVLRLTAIVIHAADLSKRRNVVGLILLFAIECFCNASEHIKPGNRYFLISVMGILLAIYTFYMLLSLGAEWWRAHRAEQRES